MGRGSVWHLHGLGVVPAPTSQTGGLKMEDAALTSAMENKYPHITPGSGPT
jgi:hypothetical protein